MKTMLLTKVLIEQVNTKAASEEYGISIVNIPDFDYKAFVNGLSSSRHISIFFLGFSGTQSKSLIAELPEKTEAISYAFTAEEAELSRNSGDESVFRILIIKRTEMEKISSLRWFPELTLEAIYKASCKYAKKKLANTNAVIDSLIRALSSKQVRSILSFERVIEYLELLIIFPENELPKLIKDNYYKLGLCSDNSLTNNNPSRDVLIKKIQRNYRVVEKMNSLDQSERQGITNYYTRQNIDKQLPRLILRFYNTKDIELLKHMELEKVEECLKAVNRSKIEPDNKKKPKQSKLNTTALAAQLVFDDNQAQIDDALKAIKEETDKEEKHTKREKKTYSVDGKASQFIIEPTTEYIAKSLTEETQYGGIIYAEVDTPEDGLKNISKYKFEGLTEAYLSVVREKLDRINDLLEDGQAISEKLKLYLQARSRIAPFRQRLQDAPMLQVLAQYNLFSDYIKAYEYLLQAIDDDFPKIWQLAPSRAKEIINILISLDYVYIVGSKNLHAIPTPLHPLYLWKYIELAKEILMSKGINNLGEGGLSEDEKAFIIHKADDIPDPLSVILIPETIIKGYSTFLPLSGRLGMLPIYSSKPQINQSESGLDSLKQQITRYLCLYPHAGLMLKLAIIDPPSVESVVGMLKALDKDKEFNVLGIELSIFRTKSVSEDWIEIEDKSINDGMLAKVKGERSLSFRLNIDNKAKPYDRIINELSQEQHLLVIFDPNEVKVETRQNNKLLHIHPLCVPKVYTYDAIDEKVEISPANEGGLFSTYSKIIERLNEHPSSFSHTGTYFHTPLKKSTYDSLLNKADWLVILDQSLKSWDASLRAASEKLYYKENSYRSIGIYSNNSLKFIRGYDTLVKDLGNYLPKEKGIQEIIEATREVNDEGLLSIISHSTNKIFDQNHGKGSLGSAIAAIIYKGKNPNSILVGLDTQLAKEWLSERDDGHLPDLIGINLSDESQSDVTVDIIEVKTYKAFEIDEGHKTIKGDAVNQTSVIEALILEMFSKTEKITTVSRREILREQVYDALFQASFSPKIKREYVVQLNDLFAGKLSVCINMNIYYVNFNEELSAYKQLYKGAGCYKGKNYYLTTLGSQIIQAIVSNSSFSLSMLEEKEAQTTIQLNQANYENNSTIADEADEIEKKAKKTQSPSESDIKESNQAELDKKANHRILEEKCARMNKVLRDFNIHAFPVTVDKVQEATRFTRFKIELKSGETIRSLLKAKEDIGIQLEANGEILIEHIKGTKYISVDVPFVTNNSIISLNEHLELLKSTSGYLNVIAGQAPDGSFEIIDIADAPHMLIAGTTGSGKTVFLQSILVSLLKQFSKDELEVLIIDPKQTDFVFFEDIPHLYGGNIVVDAEEALEKITQINGKDKEVRTKALRSCKSKNIESYNSKNPDNKLKRLVVIIDEYSDLIQAAEMLGTRKEFEKTLLMLLQRVRSLGIHFIIATQRPSAQIVTGALKAVIPFRVSFRLPSHTDSQTILDMSGAENLLGKGDMLMVTETDTKRLQGLYITENELEEFLSTL